MPTLEQLLSDVEGITRVKASKLQNCKPPELLKTGALVKMEQEHDLMTAAYEGRLSQVRAFLDGRMHDLEFFQPCDCGL